MNINEFLAFLGLHRIYLRYSEGHIQYRSSIKTPPEFIASLRENKPFLLKKLYHYESQEVLISPLSYNQQSLWFTNLLSCDNHAYNVSIPFSIFSPVDITKLATTIQQIIINHEQLRAVFDSLTNESESVPCQFILKSHTLKLNQIDASGFTDGQIRESIEIFCNKPFSLFSAPPFKVLLLSRSHNEHVLVFLFHHLICDAHSIGIFIKDFEHHYQATIESQITTPCHYTNFVSFQRQLINSDKGKLSLDFWKNKKFVQTDYTSIPSDFKRAAIRSFNGATVHFVIDKSMADNIAATCRALSITPFAMYLGCLQLLIMARTGKFNLTTGILAHGRTQAEHKGIIGYFVNPLPFPCNRSSDTLLSDHFRTCNIDCIKIIDNQHIPFSLLVEKLAPNRDPSRPVLFDLLFNMLSSSQLGLAKHLIYADPNSPELKLGDMTIKPYPLNQQEGQFDLTFELLQRDEYLQGIMKYSTDLYSSDTAKELTAQYKTIINDVLEGTEYSLITFINKFLNAITKSAPVLQKQIAIAATFSADILDESFDFWKKVCNIDIDWKFAPYNQVFQQLVDPESLMANNSDFNIILMRLEDLCEQPNGHLLNFEILKSRVCELIELIRKVSKYHKARYIVALCPSSSLFLKEPSSDLVFAEIEQTFQVELEQMHGVYFIAPHCFFNQFNPVHSYEPVAGIVGHVPYTETFFTAIATVLIRTIHAIDKLPCKAIIVDCDNTLWAGVVAEDTWQNLKVTEPFKSFQRFLLNCKEKGIIICLCSKNDRNDIIEVFEKHPDMILSLSDITFDRVNWQPKSKNINEIIQEANLSMTGIVFIDDSPSECAEVRTNCPGVTVIELSSDVRKRESYIKNFWGFDVLKVTRADIERQKMYHQEKSRHTFSEQVESYADFISGLGLEVTIREAVENDISRISQLTFRTNQFTIGSQGKNEEQMYSFTKSNQVYSVEVRDRFGDYGLVGVISYSKIDCNMFIDTFLLSCRSLGRGVEHQMASFIGNIALSTGCTRIIVDVAITGKNKPLLMFFDDIISRFKEENGSFRRYQVPPSMMVSVTFNPATYNKPQQALSGANNKSIPSVKKTFSDATLHRIAETYSDLDSIVKTISEFRRDKNKLGDNEQFKNASTIRQLPRNTLESGLAVIWTEQLGIDSINLNDNFFDLGGRSIMLPFLINKIKEKTGIDVSLVEFFQFPTISSLATHMSRVKPNDDITKCANKIVEKQRKALNQFKRNLTR